MALTELEINALKPDCTAAAAIEAKAENVAVGKVKLENLRCFALAVLAGMFIASGALFMTYVKSDATLPFAVSQVFGAAMFSLGLIMVIVAGAELFTGNNLILTASALDGRIKWRRVFLLWAVSTKSTNEDFGYQMIFPSQDMMDSLLPASLSPG